jgi:hypothetical protein
MHITMSLIPMFCRANNNRFVDNFMTTIGYRSLKIPLVLLVYESQQSEENWLNPLKSKLV